MKRITVDLDDDLYKRVKIRCAEEGLKMTDLVRRLLTESLNKAEKKKSK
jgi:plasmid stability protein